MHFRSPAAGSLCAYPNALWNYVVVSDTSRLYPVYSALGAPGTRMSLDRNAVRIGIGRVSSVSRRIISVKISIDTQRLYSKSAMFVYDACKTFSRTKCFAINDAIRLNRKLRSIFGENIEVDKFYLVDRNENNDILFFLQVHCILILKLLKLYICVQ